MATAPFRNQPLLTPDELGSRLGEFHRAIVEFNDGYFFESHETLEDLWMVTPLPERTLFQAIIQIAAAFVHVARGEYPGVFKLLHAAEEKLAGFTPTALGVDVERLLEDLRRVEGDLQEAGGAGLAGWDLRRAPIIGLDVSVLPVRTPP